MSTVKIGSEKRPQLPQLLITSTAAVGGGLIVHYVDNFLTRTVAEWEYAGWIVLIFSLCVIAYMLLLVYAKVEEILRQQRVGVRFYAVHTDESAREAYAEARRVIESAKPGSGIYILNSFEVDFKEISPAAEEARRQYLEALKSKIGTVNYHRILQVREGNLGDSRSFASLFATNYLEHYKAVIQLQQQISATRTRMEIAPARYPMSFVIVENPGADSHLIWQIDEHIPGPSPSGGAYKVAGYLFVTDPDQQIIKTFKMWFNQVANTAKRPVAISDLAPRQAEPLETSPAPA